MVSARAHEPHSGDLSAAIRTGGNPSSLSSKKRMFEDDGGDSQHHSVTQPLKKKKKKTQTTTVGVKDRIVSQRGRTGRKLQSTGSQVEEEATTDEDPVGAKERNENPSTTHRRFGSEDIETSVGLGSRPVAANEAEQSSDDEDSEDDAPEAITVAAGLEASRAAAVDAARAAELQTNAIRTKRRELDSRLKAQADAVKVRRQPKTAKKTKEPLPDLLPAELLAMDPVVRPPTPPLSVERKIVVKKTRIHDSEPKPSKDIRRGGKIIRVLQIETGVLPPKSSATSKAIREKWLMGQRGSLGGTGVPRRKMGLGFIRK